MAHIERPGAIDVPSALQYIFTKAGALASNDFNGQAEKGQLAIDYTNAKLYINTGTKAATVWTVVGAQV
jgi:hypothetical protein